MKTVEYSGSRSQWNAIFTDSGLQNVPVAPGSIDVTVTSAIRTVTAKVDGSSVPINDGKFIVTIGKIVELTVSDPQYRDRYTWAGGSGTVSADNTTYTFVAGQDDTAVTLTTVASAFPAAFRCQFSQLPGPCSCAGSFHTRGSFR